MGFSRARIGKVGKLKNSSQNYPINIPINIWLKSIGIKVI